MKASRPTFIGLLMRVVGSPSLTFYFVYVSATLSTVKGTDIIRSVFYFTVYSNHKVFADIQNS